MPTTPLHTQRIGQALDTLRKALERLESAMLEFENDFALLYSCFTAACNDIDSGSLALWNRRLMGFTIFPQGSSKQTSIAYEAVWFNITAKRYRREV